LDKTQIKIIPILIIVLLLGFIIGYAFGYSSCLNEVAKIASKFIAIDESTILRMIQQHGGQALTNIGFT